VVCFLQPLDAANDLYLYVLTTDGLLSPVQGLADANLAESAAPWTAQIKPLLDARMRQAVNAEIGLRITVSPDPKYPQIEHFGLHIDANDIAILRQGIQYIAQLQVLAISYLDNADHDSKISQFNPHYTAAERDQALKAGIEINQDVKVETDVREIRFIVFDRESNALGSVTIPVNAGKELPHEPRP
jgi:hypothetical protein